MQCDYIFEMYWTSVALLWQSQNYLLFTGNVLLALTCVALHKIYTLDPYSVMAISKEEQKHETSDLHRIIQIIKQIASHAKILVYISLTILAWSLVMQPYKNTEVVESGANPPPVNIYRLHFVGFFVRWISNISSNSYPLNMVAYVLNGIGCAVMSVGLPIAGLLRRHVEIATIKLAVNNLRKSYSLRDRVATYAQSEIGELEMEEMFNGGENSDESDNKQCIKATTGRLSENLAFSSRTFGVLSNSISQRIDDATQNFQCISESKEVAKLARGLDLLDRNFRRGVFHIFEGAKNKLKSLFITTQYIDALISIIANTADYR